MKISIFDIDDTIANFSDSFYEVARSVLKVYVDAHTYINNDFCKKYGFTINDIFNELNRREIHKNLDPIPNAQQTVQWFKDNGYQVHYLTLRASVGYDITYDWLQRHRFPIDELHILPEEGKKKWQFIEEYYEQKPEFIVEDSITNLNPIAEKGLVKYPYLVNKDWNINLNQHSNVLRLTNIDYLLNIYRGAQ